jgi:hypothetical protein
MIQNLIFGSTTKTGANGIADNNAPPPVTAESLLAKRKGRNINSNTAVKASTTLTAKINLELHPATTSLVSSVPPNNHPTPISKTTSSHQQPAPQPPSHLLRASSVSENAPETVTEVSGSASNSVRVAKSPSLPPTAAYEQVKQGVSREHTRPAEYSAQPFLSNRTSAHCLRHDTRGIRQDPRPAVCNSVLLSESHLHGEWCE